MLGNVDLPAAGIFYHRLPFKNVGALRIGESRNIVGCISLIGIISQAAINRHIIQYHSRFPVQLSFGNGELVSMCLDQVLRREDSIFGNGAQFDR